jgi:hypothetical protein
MMKIPPYFKNVETLMKGFTRSEYVHNQWESIHKEALRYSIPDKDTFNEHTEGQKKTRHIYDSTAINALEIFASKIQHGYFPEWMDFAVFKAGAGIPEDKTEEVNQYLEKVSKIFFAEFNQSNFHTEINTALKQYGIGTGCIEIEATPMGQAGPLFSFSSIPLPELYCEPTLSGAVKNSWRKHKLTLADIKEKWPKAEFGTELEQAFEGKPETEIEIFNGHKYDPKADKYWQFILYKGAGETQVIFSQSFTTMRRIIFREAVTAGETHGRGPIIRELPDIQTVNLVKDFILRNAAIQMVGIYTGIDDGVFNPTTARVAPGVILPVMSNSNQNPTLKRLEQSGDMGLAQMVLRDLQDSINLACFAQPLGDMNKPVTSAMENLLRHQADMKRSGTSFGRLFVELVVPLITGCMSIMGARGKIDRLRIDNKEVTIQMLSPLSKQKELEDFQNSQVYLESCNQLPEQIKMVAVPFERFPEYWANKLGIPLELRRSKAEIADATQKIMGMTEQLLAAQQQDKQGAALPE